MIEVSIRKKCLSVFSLTAQCKKKAFEIFLINLVQVNEKDWKKISKVLMKRNEEVIKKERITFIQ